MPLYEYLCTSCGHRFEVIQKFSDPPIEVCPKCGSPVQKVLSSPAIQFKGSGWYITDYARKGHTDAGKTGEKSGDSKPAADAGGSSESTPAASTDSGSKPSGGKASKES
jgi:putative FmdB family regulatory protein